jgi:hypothetical protein
MMYVFVFIWGACLGSIITTRFLRRAMRDEP